MPSWLTYRHTDRQLSPVILLAEWNERALILSAFENRLKSGLVLTHHANKSRRWAEFKKILNGLRVRGISPVERKKAYGWKVLPKSQVLSSDWKIERVREGESDDSEAGEDDELPCVIGDVFWKKWSNIARQLFSCDAATESALLP